MANRGDHWEVLLALFAPPKSLGFVAELRLSTNLTTLVCLQFEHGQRRDENRNFDFASAYFLGAQSFGLISGQVCPSQCSMKSVMDIWKKHSSTLGLVYHHLHGLPRLDGIYLNTQTVSQGIKQGRTFIVNFLSMIPGEAYPPGWHSLLSVSDMRK